MKIFISGRAGVGKTTLIKRLAEILKELKIPLGGFITLEVRKSSRRVGFEIIDLTTGKRELFASVEFDHFKVGKYGVNLKVFEKVAIPAVERGLKSKILLIDEIGRMEMESRWFNRKIKEVMNTKVNLIATLHRNYINIFNRYGKVYFITLENRERVFNEILEAIKKFFS